MSTLLSSWSEDVQSVPPYYVLPEDKRPGGDVAAPFCKDIPVIDLLQLAGLDRSEMIQQIMKANMNLGMFQVINHGVSEELMDETMNLFKEFFNTSLKDKAMYYPDDKGPGNFTSTVKGVNLWKHSVKLVCEPNLEDNIQSWPAKLTRYREVVKAYSVEVRKLSLRILDLICEGIGLELGHFGNELSRFQDLVVHHYPPCPEPGLVLGARSHTDINLLTLVQQHDVYGLQIFTGEQWLGVEPIPYAFVINISDQLEVISNGKLKSARHRVVTNTDVARTSLATFIMPSLESIVEPEKALIGASESLLFKSYRFKEYRDFFFDNIRDPKYPNTLDSFKL